MDDDFSGRPRARRVPLDEAVTYWRDGSHGEGRVTNLSATGFFARTESPAPVGARIEISFGLPQDRSGKIVSGEAIVVRRGEGEPPGFGARFFRISRASATMIEEFLARSSGRRA